MPLINTQDITHSSRFTSGENLQIYNGLDCCVTFEVRDELQRLFNTPPAVYDFARALQAPYLEIMQRGFRVDSFARAEATERLRQRAESVQELLDELAFSVWDKGLNPRSPLQLKQFFYDTMRLPEVWLSQKGVRKLSTNREALEKLELYMHARPFIALILTLRDIGKQLNLFETEIDPDGRFRTSYNIAGTETGRPSSSESSFGTGGNAQNISPSLRYIFVADPGKKLCCIDLEQVEARDVGYFCGCLFGDWKFLDSCEGGDLHTTNATLIWPEKKWSKDPKENRALADELFYRDFSFRDMAKRGSHLSNYYGTAWMMARSLKIPPVLAEDFQARYCRGPQAAYPGHERWWQWTATQLQQTQRLTTPFGRSRLFFGRPGDDTTLREAIAFLPQSTTADRMNLGLWRVWQKMPKVELLAQTYDSITFQAADDEGFDSLVEEALRLIRVELVAPNGRSYIVPGEAKVGWNWGNFAPAGGKARANAEGLVKWKPGADKRKRSNIWQRIVTPAAAA